MKYILDHNNLLYISDGKTVRVVDQKTWTVKDTTNPHILKKVMDYGKEVTPPYWEIK